MPYEVKKQGDKYCVVKIGGESVKCHDSKEEAVNHVKALYSNVHESAFSEFSMSIVKATSKNGEMAWRSVNSDIEEDFFGESMSVELFEDFNKHIDKGEAIPEQFKSAICEEDWCGGMPYLSIAHYKSGPERINVPGEPEKIYVDGKALKSTGILYDTPLGNAVYKSLKKDLTEKSQTPIRISIGFLDLEHSHGERFTFVRKSLTDKCPLCKEGIGDKIYKKGHLVHLALTRVPANPRTQMELEYKSMTTKLQDAESVIEDEEVLKTLELKSQAEEVLVIKTDKPEEDEEAEGDGTGAKKKKEKPVVEESTVYSDGSTTINIPIPETFTVTGNTTLMPAMQTPVEKSFAVLVEKINSLKSQGVIGEPALAELQKNFDELGNVVKSEFTPKPTAEELAFKNMESTLRSLLAEMLPQAIGNAVAPLQAEVVELRALSQAPKLIRREETPKPRNISTNLVQRAAIEALVKPKGDQFDRIAQESVGLPV